MGGEAGATVGVGGAGGSTGAGDPWATVQALTHVDLGDVSLNALTSFEVPDRVLGLTFAVDAGKDSELVGVTRLRPPLGEPVIFNYAIANKTLQTFFGYHWLGAANPQSDLPAAWPVQSGQWRIALGDDDGSLSSAHVHLWVRRTNDGLFHGGIVDVNVFLAPNSTTQGYVNQVIDSMFADYAGLGLGNVKFLPLDAGFTVVGNQAEYRAMLASSLGAGDAPAINLFVIGSFGAEFGQAIGIAGGIPGAPALHGTNMSGVAYMPSGNPQYDATVLRHEVGHLAGLFHTTEFSVEATDPLGDTSECPTATIQATPDMCPDVTNTMFPIAFGATEITAAQRRVMHGSALYRGILEQGGQPASPLPPLSPAKANVPAPSEFFASSDVSASGTSGASMYRPDKPMPISPSPLERILGAVWCSHGGGDYEGLAIRVAQTTSISALRAIVEDESKPGIMRARALPAYLRASSGAEREEGLALATALATREGASTDLRIAALFSLRRFASERASLSAKVVTHSDDAVLRAVALRVLAP